MQLKAIEPTHCAFTSLGKILEYFMIEYAFVMADTDFGAVNKSNSGALPKTNDIQEQHHRHENFMLY